jgi:hypothetical protein
MPQAVSSLHPTLIPTRSYVKSSCRDHRRVNRPWRDGSDILEGAACALATALLAGWDRLWPRRQSRGCSRSRHFGQCRLGRIGIDGKAFCPSQPPIEAPQLLLVADCVRKLNGSCD